MRPSPFKSGSCGGVGLASRTGRRSKLFTTSCSSLVSLPPIPIGSMVARWNFSTGTEGQIVSSVSDLSGNSNSLSPYTTGQQASSPIYTAQTPLNHGGLFCGGNGPGGHGLQTGAVVCQSSTSTVTIGTGSQTFTVPTGLSIIAGQPVFIFDQANPPISGQSLVGNTETGTVTSYSGSSLVVNIATVTGSGTPTNWIIVVYMAAVTGVSVILGTGSKTFSPVPTTMPISLNQWVTICQTSNMANNWMTGIVTAYSGGSLTVNVIAISGSGTLTNWTFLPVPQCTTLGGLTTAAGGISWAETPLSVLICATLGNAGGPAASGSILQVGNISFAQRGSNSHWPKQFVDYNSVSTKGTSAISGSNSPITDFPFYAGPVCLGFVHGFNGTAAALRWMLGRGRYTYTSNYLTTNTGTSPYIVGYTAFEGNNAPDGCVIHEMVIYSRALTDADLDLWQVYCNTVYGTTLYKYNGGTPISNIKNRVIFVGDSVCDSQNSLYGVSLAGATMTAIAKTNPSFIPKTEFLNYGVGSATEASHNTNIADYTALVDSTVNNILVHTGWLNDLGTRTPGDVYNGTGGTPSTSIANLISAMKTAGVNKTILSTSIDGHGDSSTLIPNNQSLNTLIRANTIGVDAVVDFAGSWLQPYVFGAPHMLGHLDNFTYLQWGSQLASTIVGYLV